jgi:hypothetical protein
VVVVREKILDNDWLYFDFDVVVLFENFYIQILYDEHVVVVVHCWDKYDFLLLLPVDDDLFDDENDEILMVKVEDGYLFDDDEQILRDEWVGKMDRLDFENVMELEEEEDEGVENYHSWVGHMTVNDFSDIHFDDISLKERKKKDKVLI